MKKWTKTGFLLLAQFYGTATAINCRQSEFLRLDGAGNYVALSVPTDTQLIAGRVYTWYVKYAKYVPTLIRITPDIDRCNLVGGTFPLIRPIDKGCMDYSLEGLSPPDLLDLFSGEGPYIDNKCYLTST